MSKEAIEQMIRCSSVKGTAADAFKAAVSAKK